MARKRPVMPSIASIKKLEGYGTNRTEKALKDAERRRNRDVPTTAAASRAGYVATAQERAQRALTIELAEAMAAARGGDDSELLPFQPTPSINPPRPRTLAMGYDRDTRIMRVRFRDGAGYAYAGVTPQEWSNMKRVKSPGKAINRTFNDKVYWPESW